MSLQATWQTVMMPGHVLQANIGTAVIQGSDEDEADDDADDFDERVSLSAGQALCQPHAPHFATCLLQELTSPPLNGVTQSGGDGVSSAAVSSCTRPLAC